MPQRDKKISAFDATAEIYDSEFTETAVGKMQRQLLWDFLEKIFLEKKNWQVLELNCGTGQDAVWMAEHGAEILATDISEKMIEVARRKFSEFLKMKNPDSSLSLRMTDCAKIDFQVCSILDAPEKFSEKKFDLIFSNFGGFNCLAPTDIENFGNQFSKILKPGGRFVAVVMSKFCWWESLYFLLKFQWKNIFRRATGQPVLAKLSDDIFVETWYFSPGEFQNLLFSKNEDFQNFKIEAIQPIGFWLPPSYLNSFFEKRPRFLASLNFLEKRFRHPFFAKSADHFLISMVQNIEKQQVEDKLEFLSGQTH